MTDALLKSLREHLPQYDHYPPEQRLWLAVLLRAVADSIGRISLVQLDASDRQPDHRGYGTISYEEAASDLQLEATAWLLDTQSRAVGSMVWICDHLDLDPDWTRRVVMEHRDRLEEHWARLIADAYHQNFRKPNKRMVARRASPK